ncbi:MAG: HAD-IA family hydrolase [Eubacteriales bacterium]
MRNRDRQIEVFFLNKSEKATEHKFAVIVSRYRGRWVFCRHKDRVTYEVPGGHVEPGESADEAAKRELYEETGAVDFEISRITEYGVHIDGQTNYAVLYYAEIKKMGELPPLEIAETILLDDFPQNPTYPFIQARLFSYVKNYLKAKQNHKQYKAVLFDLDGTIFDNFGALDKALESLYEAADEFKSKPYEQFYTLYKSVEAKYFELYSQKKMTWKEQRAYRMKSLYSHFGVDLNEEEAYEKFLVLLQLFESSWAMYKETKGVLTAIKNAGCKIGIVTNGEINQQMQKLQIDETADLFDCIIASSEYPFAKPDKQIFYEALEKLKVEKEQALFVGDSMRSDICGAKNAGIDSVYIMREHNAGDYISCEPDYMIYSLQEIERLMDI